MFLRGKEEVGNMILQADESLSAAEQEKEGTVQLISTLFYKSKPSGTNLIRALSNADLLLQ